MVHDIKIAASALATGVALIAYAPYLVAMFKGRNKPHLYTWISIFLPVSLPTSSLLVVPASAPSRQSWVLVLMP